MPSAVPITPSLESLTSNFPLTFPAPNPTTHPKPFLSQEDQNIFDKEGTPPLMLPFKLSISKWLLDRFIAGNGNICETSLSNNTRILIKP